jgi:hypothetical protein
LPAGEVGGYNFEPMKLLADAALVLGWVAWLSLNVKAGPPAKGEGEKGAPAPASAGAVAWAKSGEGVQVTGPSHRFDEPTRLEGQPAELSAWAYAYRADLAVQAKPEAYFVLRRLERLARVYRPVSLLLSQGSARKPGPAPKPEGGWALLPRKAVAERGELLPAPKGVLQSALLWEGRMQLNRLELRWPKNGAAPPPERVEVRVYPSPYGWFGWQWDEPVTVQPEISEDGFSWTYKGDWSEVDMVAAFVQPAGEAHKEGAKGPAPTPVPQIRAYGPERWKRMDVEIEWAFKPGTREAQFDGWLEGFFGRVGEVAPLPGDTGTTMDGQNAWKSRAGGGSRRGVTLSLLFIQPAIEQVSKLPRFPHGHPIDTRITVWTAAGSFTFLVRDLDQGPILAPEYGFFVTRAGSGKTARDFAAELAARNLKSIRAMTREHPEATWEEATREITLPLAPPGAVLPPYQPVADPPMQVQVPEARWVDAWREGVSQLQKGELTYMGLALEAPRPIHDMDMVGLHEAAAKWLDSFLQRSGTLSDGDFSDGSGNFCIGKLFHETAVYDCPGYDTYELVHNGGTGRILYDLAEHYFLTGDTKWFKQNQWRLQAAAEWIMRQRALYLNHAPNRADLEVAGLHPPQHIADCALGASEWKWYANIDAWYYQGLRRFGQAMAEVDPDNAGKYLQEADQYGTALRKAADRAITLAPVMPVRDGTYRSYIPPIFYIRGPSIGQVIQIAMTDDDWPLELVDAAGIPAPDDIRLDGHLDVCEDLLALKPTYLFGGNRFQFLTGKRRERGLAAAEDWFWGGFSPQLGYSFLANVYLRRDEVPSFLRQWVNNYAAFVAPVPAYSFLEHFMNHADAGVNEAIKKGEFRLYLTANGHALSYFMEQFRSLLVWEDADALWLAKATPRHWLQQGGKISVSSAPTYSGKVSYQIVSDVDHASITATVQMPSRRSPKAVWLRFRHPKAAPIKSVEVNGKAWQQFDGDRELVRLQGLKDKVVVRAFY